MPQPDVIFFCELSPTALAELFVQPGLLEELERQRYGVSLAMLDFSPQRAAVVRQLNARNVRVVAWLLLPTEEGYWFNLRNYPQAVARYHAFREWVEREQLHFAAVALDIEPLLTERQVSRTRGTLHMFNRAAEAQRNALYPAARMAYLDLAAVIRHDGYELHIYQYPMIVDDRRADTTLIQRALDIVDVPADEEVLMLYSTHLALFIGSDLQGAFVRSYGQQADGIAVGVTGGGILDPIKGTNPPRLSCAAFQRDLRIAAQYTDLVHVFSLEGCVERGWLWELGTFDWDVPVVVPRRSRAEMATIRSMIGFVLWCSRFGWTALGWLGWLVAFSMFVSQRLSRWRSERDA